MITFRTLPEGGYRASVGEVPDRLTISTRDVAKEPAPRGSLNLRQNKALVANLRVFAKAKLESGSVKDERARDYYERQAAAAAAMAEFIFQLVSTEIAKTVRGRWCSCCYQRTNHTLRHPGGTTPSAFLCSFCGSPTTPCSADCPNFARRSTARRSIFDYCAEHTHEIPSFERLDETLPAITDFRQWLRYDKPNKEETKRAANGLSTGVAALSHLAGRRFGGALGAQIVSRYTADDPSFDLVTMREGTGVPVLFADGLLGSAADAVELAREGIEPEEAAAAERQAAESWADWERVIAARYPDSPILRVKWGAEELAAMREYATARGLLATVATMAMHPWTAAKSRATRTGTILADLIVRTETERFALVGSCLGGRVMAAATRALAGHEGPPKLSEVHLAGAAIGQHPEWTPIGDAVTGGVWNYFSRNDDLLAKVYRHAEVGIEAVGVVGFDVTHDKVHDVDVSPEVAGHNEYRKHLTLK